jgi:hypothetical protein
MDFEDAPEEAVFRAEARAFLEANAQRRKPGEVEGYRRGQDAPGAMDRAMAFQRKKAEAGFVGIHWPKEWGGRGGTQIQNVIYNQEEAQFDVLSGIFGIGIHLAMPTICVCGTPEQRERFVKPTMRADIVWCQLFSEPSGGSDLASLRTRAERDGDEWVINGQKIWTTQAQYADYIFLLARTDPSAPKHAGISYLLVPMKQDGIEVRPIVQPDGSAEFNEVFFTNVRAPKENVVGGLNNGWKVAMTTLGFERGSSATTSHRRFEKELEQIIGKARDNGAIGDPTVRQQLAKQWSKIQIMRINGYRTLTAAVHDKKDLGVAALGATNKMFWSESHRDTMNLAMDILGPYGQILTGKVTDEEEFVPGYGRRHGRADYPVSITQASFFFSRSETIWGGTAEIQRNIVGERVLGLPKEPKPS